MWRCLGVPPVLERDEMAEPIREVICPITVDILVGNGPPAVLESELSYHPNDPLAVTIRLGTAEVGVCWTFARSLLRLGMFEPTGEGDVVIRPGMDDDGHALTCLDLSSPDGVAVLRTRSAGVAEFLRETEQSVPIGRESDHVDIDAVITYLQEESTA
jgi:Streptomyces sporulation and cell division protein, SsgA